MNEKADVVELFVLLVELGKLHPNWIQFARLQPRFHCPYGLRKRLDLLNSHKQFSIQKQFLEKESFQKISIQKDFKVIAFECQT